MPEDTSFDVTLRRGEGLTIAAFLFAWRKLKVGAPTPEMAIDEAKKIRETVAAKLTEPALPGGSS